MTSRLPDDWWNDRGEKSTKQLGLVGQKVIESNAFESGADVLVVVGEQEVFADWFDAE